MENHNPLSNASKIVTASAAIDKRFRSNEVDEEGFEKPKSPRKTVIHKAKAFHSGLQALVNDNAFLSLQGLDEELDEEQEDPDIMMERGRTSQCDT